MSYIYCKFQSSLYFFVDERGPGVRIVARGKNECFQKKTSFNLNITDCNLFFRFGPQSRNNKMLKNLLPNYTENLLTKAKVSRLLVIRSQRRDRQS